MTGSRVPAGLALTGFVAVCLWAALQAVIEARAVLPVNAALLVRFGAFSGAMVLAGVVAAAAASRSAQWPPARTLAVATVAVYGVFAHRGVRRTLIQTFSVSGVLPTLLYVAALAALLALAWRLSRQEPVRTGIGIAAVLLIAIGGSEAVTSSRTYPQGGELPAAVSHASPRLDARNVYFVILDEYGGAGALQTYAGYDTRPFVAQMTALGYDAVEGARSNYVSTALSLAATLDMNYVVDETMPRYADTSRFFPLVMQRPPSLRVVRELAAAGRPLIYVGSPFQPCGRWPGVTCVETLESGFLTRKAFDLFFQPTELPHVAEVVGSSGYYGSMAPLAEAVELMAGREQPFFMFVHNISPHPPYHRADCGRYWKGESGPGAYRTSVECVNRAVATIAERLRSVDPEAIVVFQADHGTGFGVDWRRPLDQWSDAAIDERSSILSLLRLPQGCREWIRPRLSPVNTMRLVMSCLEGRRPDYLPDRTFISTSEGYVDFGRVREVTARFGV